MDITSIILSLSVMAIIIVIGVFLEMRFTIGDEAKRVLIMIIVNVSLPCIILNGVFKTEKSDELLFYMFIVFFCSVFINLFGLLLGYFAGKCARLGTARAKQVAILSALGNTGFIGIPLCAMLFGPTGGLLASVFDAGGIITAFTVGVLLLQHGKQFQLSQLKNAINAPVIAIILSIILIVFKLQPPTVIIETTGRLAGLAAPLSMLYVGFLIPKIYKVKHASKFFIATSVSIFLKLLLIPFIVILVMTLFKISWEVKQVIIILSTMPTFMLASVLFEKYIKGENIAVSITIYATLLSLITIPFMSWIASLIYV